VWCGAPPDSTLLATCCLFGCAIVAWAVAALGALIFSAQQHRQVVDTESALAIGFIACVLVVVVHLAPDAIAAAMAAVMALHAALIAAIIVIDSMSARAAAPNRLH
jgi:hypothetical protein